MIKSFVVTPNFLKTLISNEILLKEFKNFYLRVSNKIFREILFLIDDEKENYREQYKLIAKDIAGKNIDISKKLKINQKTVNTYQVRIMKKLEVKSKVELFMMGNNYLKLPY